MVEIAICLAVIGIALVSIIGVLPIGMNTQRDNREETVINQDATVLLEAIRSGARGLDDLTNYVFAITNYWGLYVNGSSNSGGANGYIYTDFYIAPGYYYPPAYGAPIYNGRIIIGLLSTPEYADTNGLPIPNLLGGGYSNHVVAYVRSLSGPAVEKPPRTNDILRGDSFGYRVLCVNAPVARYTPELWQNNQTYTNGFQVYWNRKLWKASIPGNDPPPRTVLGDEPGQSLFWMLLPDYSTYQANLRELRLTFFWPLLPNGQVGPGRQSFRTLIAGGLTTTTNQVGGILYFYQPQSFLSDTNAL